MSEADKMFEELGYKEYTYLEHTDYFQEKADKIISFRNNKEIATFNTYDGTEPITMQELKAINMKCKELRMDMKPANIPVTKREVIINE